jgi:hypothetical protein
MLTLMNLRDQVLSGDFTVDRTVVLNALLAIFVVWVLEKVVGVWIVNWKVSMPLMSGLHSSFHPFMAFQPYSNHFVRCVECVNANTNDWFGCDYRSVHM